MRTCVRGHPGFRLAAPSPSARPRQPRRGSLGRFELEHVGLAEALELVLLIRDQEPAKFERAALRWHARYCREVRRVTALEAQAVLVLLSMIAGKQGKSAAQALADLVGGRRLKAESEALVRWAQL